VLFIFVDEKGVKDVRPGEIAYYKTRHFFEVELDKPIEIRVTLTDQF
jgi:hypothetical protein